MRIRAEAISPAKKRTSVLCAFCFEDTNVAIGLGKLNKKIDQTISQSIKEINGEKGKISIIHSHKENPSERVLITGLGKKNKLTSDVIRDVTGVITKKIHELKIKEFSIIIPDKTSIDNNQIISSIVEGANLSLYEFDLFKKEKSNNKEPDLTLLTPDKNAQKIIKDSIIISDAVKFTRDVANLPPNECPPMKLGEIAKKIANENKMKCTVFSKNEIKSKGLGGVTAVGQGSKNEPKFIILEYRNGKNEQKPILLVGKAVTFDTGGISLKPGEKMDEMKFDKCGGCTVLGVMKAISELKLPINVVAIIPSVENMPSGDAFRPGDIIKLFNGKTAEILNTDAEGRLILADGLAYGIKHYQPSSVMDFATLTGACIVALGTNVAAIISNNTKFASKIKAASTKTSEEVWELPINDDYMDMVKSKVADIKNLGMGRAAGTITAAAFLANSVGNVPWVHFDIAGTAWIQPSTKSKSYNSHGATGFGVRLVVDYLMNQK
ncbi:MAG: leucyl aminopeptidase [Thaumarchaeota archaeon]|nr:leucyl aminopeptidase [Nitrososphaerota archaeon]MBT4972626.1 leucyl aminopeptidase [Nitrososphaerota archaeon]MBT5237626.1 leucyl aminopeptidase [Nitrososphaerota archaeon]MBT5994054.1 leucyl aminopeptidase [Nitrososphaerota archaeon]MBT6172003.1 leucyl aminopeptidase [Nitrososphaerota archaeon]